MALPSRQFSIVKLSGRSILHILIYPDCPVVRPATGKVAKAPLLSVYSTCTEYVGRDGGENSFFYSVYVRLPHVILLKKVIYSKDINACYTYIIVNGMKCVNGFSENNVPSRETSDCQACSLQFTQYLGTYFRIIIFSYILYYLTYFLVFVLFKMVYGIVSQLGHLPLP